jgi:hypothetical protein
MSIVLDVEGAFSKFRPLLIILIFCREYQVQAGFGWTNGVLLWIGGNLGQYLQNPACPASSNRGGGTNAALNGKAGVHVVLVLGVVNVIAALMML